MKRVRQGIVSMAVYLLPVFLRCHSYLYRIISTLVVKKHDGVHPKHDILKYHAFFAANIRETDRVVDIGCGTGENAFDMAKKAAHVTGIDIEQRNIQKAQSRYQRDNLRYIVGDALTYPFSETFDVIALSNVLEHIEHRVPFLQQLQKLSHRLLLRVPMINRDWLTIYKQQQGMEHRLDPTHYIEYTMETLRKEVDASGWKMQSYSIQFGEVWAVLTCGE